MARIFADVTAFGVGWKRLTPAVVLSLVLTGVLRADEPSKPLAIGASAIDFRLPGVDGKTYSLADFADAKVLAIVFTCNHCPTAQAYEDRIIELDREYRSKGVRIVAVSPNDPLAVRLDELGYTDLDDSFADMKIRAKDKKFAFPYLYDGETQEMSRKYGVLATPHVYIFDKERILRYVGRIADAEGKAPVKSYDAKNAIDALLAGTKVPVATTRVFGCSTKWSDKRESARVALAKENAEKATLETLDPAGLKSLLGAKTKSYRLVNVWATWCGPCVQELPELTTMHRMYRKRPFEMITISVDKADKHEDALKVLNEHHLSAKNYRWTMSADNLAEQLDPEWPGPVPYTVLIAPDGKIVYRKVGQIDVQELRRAIVEHIGRTF